MELPFEIFDFHNKGWKRLPWTLTLYIALAIFWSQIVSKNLKFPEILKLILL